MSNFVIGFFLLLGALIVAAMVKDVSRQHDAQAQAQVMRCNHIGSLHAMRNIGVFECGDTIVLKRIEDQGS